MRIIHSADWQIGKPFRQFEDKEGTLRQARLVAIEKIGQLATQECAPHILVAGDVFDTEAPTPRTLLEPLERMRGFPTLQWHLLPGNHDPHRPGGVWDRVRDTGMPSNVHLHLTAEPYVLDESAVLLPAPLTRKSESGDLTEWMDRAETAAGMVRIGIAHGSVVGFGSGGEANNPINPRRPSSAGLDYLALGDWHRTVQVGPKAWYAGTSEADRFGSQEIGQALAVDIAGPGAPPLVVPHEVGSYRWLTHENHLTDATDLDTFDASLRALPELSCTILRLALQGALPLADLTELDRRLLGLSAALFHLTVDRAELVVQPTESDLEAIDFDGVLRRAADQLGAMARDGARGAEERRRATDALVELYRVAVVSNGGVP